MFAQKFKSIFVFWVIFSIRFVFCIVVGWLLLFAIPFFFCTTTDNLNTLEGFYIVERIDGDLLEFYSVAQELEVYGADNEVLGGKSCYCCSYWKGDFLMGMSSSRNYLGFFTKRILESR